MTEKPLFEPKVLSQCPKCKLLTILQDSGIEVRVPTHVVFKNTVQKECFGHEEKVKVKKR